MISAEHARMRRIIRLVAQILRALGSANTAALLKGFFNDSRLITAGECGDFHSGAIGMNERITKTSVTDTRLDSVRGGASARTTAG